MRAIDKRSGIICLLLAIAVAAVYWPVRHFDFLIYDDTIYVSLNANVHKGLSWSQVGWAFTTLDCSMWHPMTWLSLLLDWQLFGADAGKHHLSAVALHIGSTLFLFLAWKKMTGLVWRSAFVAAIFALHPLRVESVAWAAERKDVLSTLFSMMTLWAYARYAEAKSAMANLQNAKAAAPRAGRSRFNYFLTLSFFTLGLMAKPMLVTLPFVMLLLDYWPLKRLPTFRSIRPLLLEKIPFLVLSLAAIAITFWAASQGSSAVTSLTKLPFGARVGNMFVSYLHYVQCFFWPQNLASPYPHPIHWPVGHIVIGIVVLLAGTALAFFSWRRQPWIAVGWLWFLGTLVPVIGLVQVGAHAYGDRYTYISMIGISAAVVWSFLGLTARWSWQKPLAGVLAGLALLGCIIGTRNYLRYWQNTKTLFEHTLSVTKNNAFAHNNLGVYLVEHGNFNEAIEHGLAALKIVPTYPDPHQTLAFAYTQTQRFTEALIEYPIALKFDPNNSKLHNGYGTALGSQGKMDDACAEFARAVTLEPAFKEAHGNWGLTLQRMGKLDEAAARFQEELRLDPNDFSSWRSLANLWVRLNKLDDAEKCFRESLRLKPDNAAALSDLGAVYFQRNKFVEAAAILRDGLHYDPNNLLFHFNLGLALSGTGQTNAAIAEFQEVLRLKPDSAEAQEHIRRLTASQKPIAR